MQPRCLSLGFPKGKDLVGEVEMVGITPYKAVGADEAFGKLLFLPLVSGLKSL